MKQEIKFYDIYEDPEFHKAVKENISVVLLMGEDSVPDGYSIDDISKLFGKGEKIPYLANKPKPSFSVSPNVFKYLKSD